jgi:hypothetical protein
VTAETTFIYALKDPRSDEVRYVGKSDAPARRWRFHQRDKRSNAHRYRWLQQLKRDGLEPALVILEQCQMAEWPERERYWEAYFRAQGARLTNMAPCGGGPAFACATPAVREKMRQAALARPHPKHTPESLEKCRMAAQKRALTQHALTVDGVTKTIPQWAAALGVSRGTIRERLERGWDAKTAVTTPAESRAERARGRKHSQAAIEKMRAAVVAHHGKTWQFVSPFGQIVETQNLSAFCDIHRLRRCSMMRAHCGEQDAHRGWIGARPEAVQRREERALSRRAAFDKAMLQRRGEKRSEETREKLRRAMLGKRPNDETRAKMSAAHMGCPRPDLRRTWGGFLDPAGNEVPPITEAFEDWCAKRELCRSKMGAVYRGARYSHRGYTHPEAWAAGERERRATQTGKYSEEALVKMRAAAQAREAARRAREHPP